MATTPVFLPGEFQGQGSLVGCLLWGRTESDMTEATQQQQQQQQQQQLCESDKIKDLLQKADSRGERIPAKSWLRSLFFGGGGRWSGLVVLNWG